MSGPTEERTVPLASLPVRRRPCLEGVHVGQVVTGACHGRRFRVLRTDQWVIGPSAAASFDPDEDLATGPYAELQALDDKHCRVIWPRAWYVTPGQQMSLFGGAA